MNVELVGADGVKAMLAALAGNLPKAAEQAQNKMIYTVWTAERQQIAIDINKPVAWTVGAILYKKVGTPTALQPDIQGAAVYMANAFVAGSFVGPDQYLGVQILGGETGGPRRSEKALQRAGIIGPDTVWVPATGVKLTAEGNVPGGTISAMITDLGFNPYAQTKDKNFCLIGKPAKGVLAKVASGGESVWLPFLWFVPRRDYEARWDFYGRANLEIGAKFQGILSDYIDKAVQESAR